MAFVEARSKRGSGGGHGTGAGAGAGAGAGMPVGGGPPMGGRGRGRRNFIDEDDYLSLRADLIEDLLLELRAFEDLD